MYSPVKVPSSELSSLQLEKKSLKSLKIYVDILRLLIYNIYKELNNYFKKGGLR